ncbi:MAG: hypothetical protein GWQ05_00585 [Verrucomicrobiaceae bacterium]|nr:hypothetical protein [Verrucomicrobiaceae bacterium]NCF89447.1 hypothetical protein [Verrucomicrobiaceae bacterium]
MVRPQRTNALPEIGLANVELASARLSDPILRNGDRLFVSELIFLKGGKLRPFESELRDAWLGQYAFAKNDPFIDTRDPDKGLLTNLKKWQNKTGPSLSSNHPTAIMKVSLLAMIESDPKLVSCGRVNSSTWQTDLASKAALRSQNYLPAVGESFGPDKRFRLDLSEEKRAPDAHGIPQDNSVVTVSGGEAGHAERASVSLVQSREGLGNAHSPGAVHQSLRPNGIHREKRGYRAPLADPEIDLRLNGGDCTGTRV